MYLVHKNCLLILFLFAVNFSWCSSVTPLLKKVSAINHGICSSPILPILDLFRILQFLFLFESRFEDDPKICRIPFLTEQAMHFSINTNISMILRNIFCPRFFKTFLIFNENIPKERQCIENFLSEYSLIGRNFHRILEFRKMKMMGALESTTTEGLYLGSFQRYSLFVMHPTKRLVNDTNTANKIVLPRLFQIIFPKYEHKVAMKKWELIVCNYVNMMNLKESIKREPLCTNFPNAKKLEKSLCNLFYYGTHMLISPCKPLLDAKSLSEQLLEPIFGTDNFCLQAIKAHHGNPSRVIRVEKDSFKLVSNSDSVLCTLMNIANQFSFLLQWNRSVYNMKADNSELTFVIWSDYSTKGSADGKTSRFIGEETMATKPVLLLFRVSISKIKELDKLIERIDAKVEFIKTSIMDNVEWKEMKQILDLYEFLAQTLN